MGTEQLSTNQNLIETQTQPQQSSSGNNKLVVTAAASVLLTAIVSGLAVYFWQKSVNEKSINNLEQKIVSLEEQISTIKKVEISPQPTSLPVLFPTPTTETATNWKTHTNSDYNFIVKYPPTLKSQVLAAGAGTKEALQNARSFYIYDPELEETYINRYISFEVLGIEPSYGEEWTKTQTTVGNKTATKLINSISSSNFDVYLVELNDDQGIIEIYVSNSKDKKVVVDQILSTFQLIN